MTKTKIFTVVFAITSVVLAFVLYNSINSTIQETNKIERIESAIIEQLKMIREAQIAHKAVKGSYTSDWNKLIDFVKNDFIYITEKTETITQLSYGGESIEVKIDTIGRIPVIDSIFNASKFPNFNLTTLAIVPFSDPQVQFNMWADKITRAGVLVDVVEVWDPNPINPKRSLESELNSKKSLRFGSRTNVTVAGNWE